jgi:hypothetical protein
MADLSSAKSKASEHECSRALNADRRPDLNAKWPSRKLHFPPRRHTTLRYDSPAVGEARHETTKTELGGLVRLGSEPRCGARRCSTSFTSRFDPPSCHKACGRARNCCQQRELASQLSVSRSAVVSAYEQLLAEGYACGKTGSGTYVSSDLPEADRVEKREERKATCSRTRIEASRNALRRRFRRRHGSERSAAFQLGAHARGPADDGTVAKARRTRLRHP